MRRGRRRGPCIYHCHPTSHPSITTNTAGFKLILDISAQRAESRGESLPAGGYRVSLRHPLCHRLISRSHSKHLQVSVACP